MLTRAVSQVNRRETRNRGAKRKEQARDQAYVDAMRMFLGSLDSFLSLSICGMEPSEKPCAEVPESVRKCSRLVGGSLLAGPNNKLGVTAATYPWANSIAA